MPIAICPQTSELEQLFAGSADAALERVEGHVQACDSCLARLKELLAAKDTVLDVFAGPDTLGEAAALPSVRQLMKKLETLQPAAKDDATAGFVTPSSGSPISGTEADEPQPEEEFTLTQIGPYKLIKKLGAGGMGLVFEALDTHLERSVALKVMKPSLAKSAGARKRFLQEARSAAKIQHDHVVPIFQVGEDQGVPFLAMQLLEGTSLADLLKSQGAMQTQQVVRLGMQIAEGLEAAHARGMIHRDIKPANIWVEPSRSPPWEGGEERGVGRIKILDFGLARLEQGSAQLTQSGMIVGTPAYMAPEQGRGDKNLDHRVDLFSLGCVLYFMTTGQLPFTGNDPISVMMAVQMHEPPPPHEANPEVPPALSDLIVQLLAKDPARRPASAREVVRSLGAVAASYAVAGPPPAVVAGSPDPATHPTEGLQVPASGGDLRSGPVARSVDRATTTSGDRATATSATTTTQGVPRRRRLVLVAIAAGLLALVAAGVFGIIRISTPEGDYVIQTDDPDFSFSVSKGVVSLRDKKTAREYAMKVVRQDNGIFDLDVTDVGADLSFQTNELRIKRGQQVALKAHFERKQAAEANRPRAGDADGRAALAFRLGDHVVVPSLTYDGRTPLTLEAWVRARPDSLKADRAFYPARLGPFWLKLKLPDSGFEFAAIDPVLKTDWVIWNSTQAVLLDQWVHLAGQWDGSAGTLFVNGKKTAGAARPAPGLKLGPTGKDLRQTVQAWIDAARSKPLYIGVPESFAGDIRAVRVSNAIRYQGPFTPSLTFESDADTLALYRFDEGQGEKLKDSSGKNHHGKIAGTKWVKIGEPGALATGVPPNRFTNTLGMEFALVPKGKAWLGGGGGKPGDQEVEFKDDFYLGVYEVTQEEWEKVIGGNPSAFSRNGRNRGEVKQIADAELKRFPVEQVSGDDAQLFLARLNEQMNESGWLYRLPTSTEWEYACRGGPLRDKADSGFDYYFGRPTITLLPGQANFGFSLGQTCRVGSYQPNSLGIHDMHGNVWEWCADKATADPKDPHWTQKRMARGGSWGDSSSTGNLRAAARFFQKAWQRDAGLGLRVIRVAAARTGADRKAAAWVLSVGDGEHTSITVTKNGVERQTRELPAGDFELTGVTLQHNDKITDADMVHLKDCTNLRNIMLRKTRVTQGGIDALRRALPKCRIEWDGGVFDDARFTNTLGMQFAIVPQGKAWLGGGGGKPGDKEVEFKDDFYLGVYEVTQEEWLKVMGKNPSAFQAVAGVAKEDLKRFPVDNISWEDAQQFIKRLNEQVKEPGWVYRLPKGAEWEYACRGGPIDRAESAFDFYFGKPALQMLPEQANFDHGSALKRTCKVGSYPPNRLGLHDMHGNVWELCDDVLEGQGVVTQVMRGGCWKLDAAFSRAARPFGTGAKSQNHAHGLRVARVPVGAGSAAMDRKAALGRGAWRIVGDVIEHPVKDKSALLLFGRPDFGDGDFTCEVLRAEGDNGLALVARATDLEHYYYFEIGGFKNQWHSIYAKEPGMNWRRIDQKKAAAVSTERWVAVRLKMRGPLFEGYVDDQLVLSGKDDRRLQGYIGLRTWNEAGKYRNLKLTTPDGTVLWQGLPDLSTLKLSGGVVPPAVLSPNEVQRK